MMDAPPKRTTQEPGGRKRDYWVQLAARIDSHRGMRDPVLTIPGKDGNQCRERDFDAIHLAINGTNKWAIKDQ
jgi:hypothetical protein